MTITVIQAFNATGGPADSITFTTSVPAGSVIVAAGSFSLIQDDTNTNGYQIIPNARVFSGSGAYSIAWCVANVTGTPTVTIDQDQGFSLIAFAGFVGTPTVDAIIQAYNDYNSGGSASLTQLYWPATTTFNNEVLVAALTDTNGSPTGISPWVSAISGFNGGLYVIESTAGTNVALDAPNPTPSSTWITSLAGIYDDPSTSPIFVTQLGAGSDSPGDTNVITMPNAVQVGDVIIIQGAYSSEPAYSDNLGTTYNVVYGSAASGAYIGAWFGIVTEAGTPTITGTVHGYMHAFVTRGWKGTVTVDPSTQYATTTTSGTVASTTLTTAHNRSLVLAQQYSAGSTLAEGPLGYTGYSGSPSSTYSAPLLDGCPAFYLLAPVAGKAATFSDTLLASTLWGLTIGTLYDVSEVAGSSVIAFTASGTLTPPLGHISGTTAMTFVATGTPSSPTLPVVNFPTSITDFTPTFLVGGNANTQLPSMMVLGGSPANAPQVQSALRAGAQRYTVSGLPGFVADLDLLNRQKIGGGVPTDNLPVIQPLVAAATETAPVIMIIDVAVAKNGAVVIPIDGHVVLEGCGWDTGFFSMAASADMGIRCLGAPNYPTLQPGQDGSVTPPTQQVGNLVMRNFKIDGNCQQQSTTVVDGLVALRCCPWDGLLNLDNCPTTYTFPNGPAGTFTGLNPAMWSWVGGNAGGPVLIALQIGGVQNVWLDHVWIYDPCSSCIWLINASNFHMSNCLLQGRTPFYGPFGQPASDVTWGTFIRDGLHISGPVVNALVENCTFLALGDDAIAINVDEGYQQPGSQFTVVNCNFVETWDAMRVDGSASALPSLIRMSNCTGTIAGWWLLIGTGFGGDNSPYSTDIALSDITCNFFSAPSETNPDPVFMLTNVPIANVVLDNITILSPAYANLRLVYVNFGGDSLTIDARVIRNAQGNEPFIIGNFTDTLGTLRIKSWSIEDIAGSSYAAIDTLILTANAAAISKLWVDSIDMTHITNFIDTPGNVTSVGGPGLLQTNTAWADSQVLNDTVYLSSTQSGIAYKDNTGTVHKFTTS